MRHALEEIGWTRFPAESKGVSADRETIMMATTLLRDHHRRLQRLLARLGSERQLRMPLVLQLVEELMTHLSIEDHFFLCPVADKVGIRVDTYRDEQARVRNAVLQAVFAETDDGVFDARLQELEKVFLQHARVLERDLFPLVETHVRTDDLEVIGDRMQVFWDAAVGPARPTSSTHEHAAE